MKVTAQEEYGLRCALQLARAGLEGSLTIPEIAEREGLSTAYVGKLLQLLRQANLIRSVRGRSGGYSLSRAPREISVSDVMAVLGTQPWQATGCARFTGVLEVCVNSPRCAIRTLWGALDSVVGSLLRSITLEDLLNGKLHGVPGFPVTDQPEYPVSDTDEYPVSDTTGEPLETATRPAAGRSSDGDHS